MPPATLPEPAPAPALSLSTVAFFGRSFAEYCRFFALDPVRLRGRPVLDVAAGPSSFTAEACRAGIDAVAVDPLYGCTAAALASHVQIDYDRMFRQLRQQPGLVRLRSAADDAAYFESLEAAERDRRAAAARFLEDYAAHFVHGRYFGAVLPQLPFLDHTFDVVLCAHLLFVYGDRLDYPFHLAACRELVRVSRDEVRIHPLCGLDGRVYPQLRVLLEELGRDGIEAEVRQVNYGFFRGASETLILRRAPGC